MFNNIYLFIGTGLMLQVLSTHVRAKSILVRAFEYESIVFGCACLVFQTFLCTGAVDAHGITKTVVSLVNY